ncbi:hypothetical protein Pint_21784 [Pistacia integerrima]|uniref:Uncharacterized protein n=1 Tax=Pistacia integerrima TaxID=434235 RepID=A0ACC0X8V9_9ROSI|nr:hypothetical protein Pint_21784 [Pistacia integerrima]
MLSINVERCQIVFSCIKFDELQILPTLKTALQGSNTDVLASWVSSNHVCNFTGITCNSDDSIKEIELSNQQLTGTFLFDSICRLQSLDKLSFGFNSLYGTISKELNNCVKLQYLDLGNNGFLRSFPRISSLTELHYLYLNNSGCSSVFPWASLENMMNLVSLSLGDHNFSPTPFPVQVLKVRFHQDICKKGTMRGLLMLQNKFTDIELNQIEGPITKDIGNVKALADYMPETIGYPVNYGGNLKTSSFVTIDRVTIGFEQLVGVDLGPEKLAQT